MNSRRLLFGLVALGSSLFLTGSSRATVVAVIDTGVDPAHPSLHASLWENPGESGFDARGRDKRSNGIDDDGNGFVDDVHGWNFVDDTNRLDDRHGHGTHIAGLIAGARPGQPAGKEGPRLMILKYYDPGTSDRQNLLNTVRAIDYATKMGARIINYSGGGFGRNELEEDAIRRASERGILFVAAAGNERANSDVNAYYPADYRLPNILSVGALGDDGNLIPSSNYGARTVHVGAAGQKVLSTMPGGWGRMTGTSQAAAIATATAVELLNRKPGLRTPEDIIGALIRQGRREPGLKNKTRYQVRLAPALLDTI